MSKLDCLFVYATTGPHHRAYLNDCNQFMRCGLVQAVKTEAKYPWSSEVKLECDLDVLCEQFPKTRQEGLRARQAYAELLDRYQPSVVFHGGCYDIPFMRSIARDTVARGIASILMSDSTAADHPRRVWTEAAKRWLLRGAYTGAICAGSRSRAYLLSLGFDDRMIWNGVDAVDNGHFSKGADDARSDSVQHRTRLNLPQEYVLCVARHSEEKRIDILLHACALAFRERSNCSLVLCGSGPLSEELRRLAASLSMTDRVHFVGWTPYGELPYYYGLAAVSVLPSVSEPWGLVVNESLAAGTPVITSEICGCVPELVRRGVSGSTCIPGDTHSLATALQRALERSASEETRAQARSVVAPWSIRNRTLGILDCVRALGGRTAAGTGGARA